MHKDRMLYLSMQSQNINSNIKTRLNPFHEFKHETNEIQK